MKKNLCARVINFECSDLANRDLCRYSVPFQNAPNTCIYLSYANRNCLNPQAIVAAEQAATAECGDHPDCNGDCSGCEIPEQMKEATE